MPTAVPVTPPVAPGPPAEPLRNPAEPGWTLLSQHPNAKTFYVDAVSGNDNNGGESPGDAFRTAARGSNAIVPGRGDWLLFRRGQTFSHAFGNAIQSGRDDNFHTVYGSYGQAHVVRPKFVVPVGQRFAASEGGSGREYVTFLDLEITPAVAEDDHGFYLQSGHHFRIEGCYIHHCETGIVLAGANDISLHRNVSAYNGGHGLFSFWTDRLVATENLFFANGDPSAGAFEHGVYIDNEGSPTGLQFHRNLFLNNAGNGIQQRPGGLAFNNYAAYNGTQFLWGGGDSWPENPNVYFEARDNVASTFGNSSGTEWGMEFKNIAQGFFTGNLIINSTANSNSQPLIIGDTGADGKIENVIVENNIVYGCRDAAVRFEGGFPNTNFLNVTFRYNDIVSLDDSLVINFDGPSPAQVYSDGNRFYSTKSGTLWYNMGSGTPSDLSDYHSKVGGPDNSVEMTPTQMGYVDPDSATLPDYYTAVTGIVPQSLDEVFAVFLGQRKGKWLLAWTADVVNAWMRSKFGL